MVFIRLLTAVIFLVSLFHVSAASTYETFHVEGNQFFQIVQDPKTQDVYVGGRNKIYHLDSKLKLKQEITVGPSQDSPQCLPRGKCNYPKTKRNNNIVVLEIEPSSQFLFACGTVKQGACMKYDLADIKSSANFSAIKDENFVGSNKSSVAFFDFNPLSNTSILYVAMSYDGRMINAFPKTISERVISKSQTGLNLSYRESFLGIPTDKTTVGDIPIEYLYGFKHKNFVYYVSLQGNKSFIGRVCDYSDFYYYVEVQLGCWSDKLWNNATAAKLISNINKSVLVTYYDENSNQSMICEHALTEIESYMKTSIKECYDHADPPREAPAWIQKNRLCVETLAQEEINEDTCGYDQDNGYISGRNHATVHLFKYKGKFTAIQSYIHDGNQMYLFGTSTGHLLKMKKQTRKLELIVDTDISSGSGQPIQRDMEMDSKKSHVYAISGSTVIRFPIKSCSIYTSCATCVTNKDPLKCGWCHDKCTSHSECSNGWSPDCCVPQILSIFPTKGPMEGTTRLTIRGEYFANGNDKGEMTVKVGTAPCLVVKSNSTVIFCNTATKGSSVTEGNIHVKISAESPNTTLYPKIDGEGRSKEIFYFMIPEIYNFTPAYGPVAGGTKLNITGKNLNIGSTVKLYIGDQSMTILRRTRDKIFALTPKVSKRIKDPLKLQIEGKILITKNSYRYTPDPKVDSVLHGSHTIKSGGIDIEFKGRNLNTVQNPMLSGNVVRTEAPLPSEKCVPNEDGTKLICKTPPMNDTSEDMIPADLRLEMDGVEELRNFGKTHPTISRIKYLNDPILNRFDHKDNLFFYGKTTKSVEIKGKFITDVVGKENIIITIGGIACSITKLSNQAIFCTPTSVPKEHVEHQKFQVLVKIGYRTYNIGWILFVSTSTAHVKPSIIALIAILICIFIVIGILFYCMWKKKLVFFKEKSILPAARYAGNDQVHFGENGRLIINSNEYTERQNFLPVQTVGATSCPVIDESILLVLGDKKLLIPKEALQITEKIGQGHFGCVYRALYRKPGEKGEMLVAVKTLHKDHPRDMDIQGFLDEALIMKDFDHENILSLIGICLGKDHMPLVVLPYMAHGDLLSYLRNVNNQPTVKDLIIFGISIASGMDYLASLKFVHRDLAARNCMLNDRLVVKVADFGLSRDIYERDYYSSDNKKSKLPVKWMALESLENGTYNTKTDVWSYGVVLWELFTRGVNPYPTVDNWDMPKYLKLGRRMDKPDYCPNRIYDIMLCCWEFDQNLRPDFATIFKELTELSEMEKHRDLPCYQKTPYENVDY